MNSSTRKRPEFPAIHYDVYLVGRYFCDLVFTRLPELPRLGHEVYAHEFHLVPGGVATPAIALTRLGLRVAWPCIFGADVFSRHIRELVTREKVDLAFFSDSDQPSLRISVAFSFEGERAFLSYTDPLPELPHPHLIRQTRPAWLYITHLIIGDALQEMVAAARQVGARVYMDCQAHDYHISDAQVGDALQAVDVFSPNLEEARALTGEQDTGKILKMLGQLTPTVILKQGAAGCLCRQGIATWEVAAIPARVVDTTGAGDNFNCGFLFGQLNRYTLPDSLRMANLCGSFSVQGYGGASTSPTRQQAMASFQSAP